MSFVFTLSLQTLTFVYFSAERGAPPKHAQNATTITKLKNSKCQNIFRCIFDDSFVRMHLTTFFFFEFFNMDSGRIFRCFHEFFRIVIAHENVIGKAFFYSQEFFWILYCLRIFNFHELSSQNSIFVHRLFWRIWEFSIF